MSPTVPLQTTKTIAATKNTNLLSRVANFLPQIQAANEILLVEVNNKTNTDKKQQNRVIDMDLEIDDDDDDDDDVDDDDDDDKNSEDTHSSNSTNDESDETNESKTDSSSTTDSDGSDQQVVVDGEHPTRPTSVPMIQIKLALGDLKENPAIQWLVSAAGEDDEELGDLEQQEEETDEEKDEKLISPLDQVDAVERSSRYDISPVQNISLCVKRTAGDGDMPSDTVSARKKKKVSSSYGSAAVQNLLASTGKKRTFRDKETFLDTPEANKKKKDSLITEID